jgi:putative membrane protein
MRGSGWQDVPTGCAASRRMPMVTSESRFDVEPSVTNHFAWMRTQMGLERTLMAAARTAVSLIGFGFTVAQFFEKLVQNAPGELRHLRPETPRDLGLALIAAGVISLTIFTLQYRAATAYLREGEFAAIAGIGERSPHSSTYLISFVVIAIGLAAFVSVFARL